MSEEVLEYTDRNSMLFSCECYEASHMIHFAYNREWASLYVMDFMHFYSLADRLRGIWRCITRPMLLGAEVQLTPAKARAIAAALNEWADHAPQWEAEAIEKARKQRERERKQAQAAEAMERR